MITNKDSSKSLKENTKSKNASKNNVIRGEGKKQRMAFILWMEQPFEQTLKRKKHPPEKRKEESINVRTKAENQQK